MIELNDTRPSLAKAAVIRRKLHPIPSLPCSHRAGRTSTGVVHSVDSTSDVVLLMHPHPILCPPLLSLPFTKPFPTATSTPKPPQQENTTLQGSHPTSFIPRAKPHAARPTTIRKIKETGHRRIYLVAYHIK